MACVAAAAQHYTAARRLLKPTAPCCIMACEDESKSDPPRRAAASGGQFTLAKDWGQLAKECRLFLAGQGSTQAVARALHKPRLSAAVAASQSSGAPIHATFTLRLDVKSHNVGSIAARLVELYQGTPDELWATIDLNLSCTWFARAQR